MLLENGHVFTRTVVVQLNPFQRHIYQTEEDNAENLIKEK